MLLNEKIKLLRTKKDITQKQLAEILDIQPNSVQRLEYGTARPSLDTLIALADFFNVNLDYLVGRTNFPDMVMKDEVGNIVVMDKPSTVNK